MKVEPLPSSLSAWISPPSSRAISRLIDSPRPVPPYLRLVVPSACRNGSKISRSLSPGMPIPVSDTVKAISGSSGPWIAPASSSCSRTCCGTPPPAGLIEKSTAPVSVNFTALEMRLRSTCWSRCSSVCRVTGRAGETRTSNSRFLSSATGWKVAST